MSAYFSVDRLCSEAIVERLGWVLVHSMWQFAAVAIMAAVIAEILRRSSATARYGVLVIAMAMTVVAPCVTWIFIPASGWASALREDTVAIESQPSNASEDESIGDAKLGPTGSEIAMSLTGFEESKVVDFKIDEQTRRADAQPLAETLTNILRPWFTWIVGGWVIGVLLCSLRPLLGWRMLRRLRRVGISPPSDEVVAALQRVSQRLGIRRAVQVLHSTLATGPLVVGYLRPVVLLPVSLVTSIPMPQLEAILAHELTHIRRHDFLINLAQTLVETLFFYHPAVWWLSRQIRIEREHCCDDLVVKVFHNTIDYGRALLAIEQFQGQRTVMALGAADGSLLERIRRIVEQRSMNRAEGIERGSAALLSLVSLCLLVILSTAWTSASQETNGDADVKNSKSPLADVVFGQGEQVSGKDGPKDPAGKDVEVVPVTDDNIPAAASDDLIPDETGEPEVLTIRKDETRTIESNFRFVKIEGFSPEIVSVRPAQTPKRLQVQGKSLGSTGLMLTDEYGEEYSVRVAVVADDAGNQTPADRVFRLTSANLLPKCLSNDESKLTLLVGGSIELDFPWLVSNTQESDRGIIQTQVVKAKHRLSVRGISPGKATLRVFNASLPDRQERQIDVEVLSVTRTNILAVFGKCEKIAATLPDGITVELLGVSTPPIALPSNDNREWWRVDGTTMDAAPIPGGSVHVGTNRTDGREFVFRMSEMAGAAPTHVTLKQRFKDDHPYEPEGNGWSMGSTQSGHLNGDPKASWQATIEHVAGPIGDADSATLEIRIGSGTDAEMLYDAKGQRTNGDSKDDVWQLAAVQKMAERIEVLRTGEHEDGFAIWTKPFSSSTDEGNLDVGLLDINGMRHHPFGSSSDGNENVFSFKIKPEQVDAIIIRLRPFQYLAMFENVSLKPGRKSDVRISVKSLGL